MVSKEIRAARDMVTIQATMAVAAPIFQAAMELQVMIILTELGHSTLGTINFAQWLRSIRRKRCFSCPFVLVHFASVRML